MQIEQIAGLRCTVGESPLWCATTQAWYWVDIVANAIWRLDAAGTARRWMCAEMVACIALRHDGALIAGMQSGLFRLELDPRDGQEGVTATLLARPPELRDDMRFNDGRCDRQGRFWSGTMAFDVTLAPASGHLYRYDGHGLSPALVSGLVIQNGLAWSPDGRTMYLSDSHVTRQLIWAYDYDTDSGTPSGRRLFVDMNQHPGRPDGAAVDADGCYWTCANDGGCLLRFTPDGRLDRRIDVPVAKPSMCAFGGPDLDTLLVTSISKGAPDGDAQAGAVLMLRPGVRGLAEQPFGQAAVR